MAMIGHQRILDFFKKSIKNNRLAHAYLFVGATSLGKKKAALELIQILNKDFGPDVLITEPIEGKEISIDQIRKVQHQLNMSPYSAPYKIALIDEAERMTEEAGNCLLKTLEEPAGKSILILIAANTNLLLPTIISRCQVIKFLPVENKEIKNIPGITEKIVQLSNGRPGIAFKYIENPELIDEREQAVKQLEKLIKTDLNERYQFAEKLSKDNVQARQTLNYWIFWFRDLILSKVGCPDMAIYPQDSSYSLPQLKKIIQTIRKTNEVLSNSSFNSRLALEALMLEF